MGKKILRNRLQDNWRKSKKKKIFIHKSLIHLALISISVIFIFPFYWLVSTSLKSNEQIFTFSPVWIPNPPQWVNYIKAWTFVPFATYLKNTLIICTSVVIGTVLSCSLVAYGFSRIKWVGRDTVFMLVLVVMMIPFQVRMIPLFIVFRSLGWLNTFLPLIVPTYFGVAFYIFLLRQFFLTIPFEFSDAARVDGASDFWIWSRVILPLSKPAIATTALFQWIDQWEDFMGPLIYINDPKKFTLSLGLQQFQSQHLGVEWGLLMAASTIMVLPIIVLFFFTQKTFIQGITMSGLKG